MIGYITISTGDRRIFWKIDSSDAEKKWHQLLDV